MKPLIIGGSGKIGKIFSNKKGILKSLPKTFVATRYHSLIVDKKTLSNYMVHRFLSMKPEWIEVVNEIQRYW